MFIPADRTINYPDAGYCIYCGDSSSPETLTREHILPYALGGNSVLPKSSCPPCSRITQEFEQHCLRGMFRRARANLGIQTRRPREMPTEYEVDILSGHEMHRRTVPVIQDPACFLYMPGWKQPPDILGLGNPPVPNGIVMHYRTLHGKDEILGRIQKLGFNDPPIGVEFKLRLSIMPFWRMLAKIAHAQAMACIDATAFEPLLIPLILKGEAKGLELIGAGPPARPHHRHTHAMQLEITHCDTGCYLGAEIRLFPSLGAPGHRVIIGRVLHADRIEAKHPSDIAK